MNRYIVACSSCLYAEFNSEEYLKQESPFIYICKHKKSKEYNKPTSWHGVCDYFKVKKKPII